jgi:hypothetical protein
MVRTGLGNFLKGVLDPFVIRMAEEIDKEEIIPGLTLTRTGLDLAKVDPA